MVVRVRAIPNKQMALRMFGEAMVLECGLLFEEWS